MIIKRKRKRKTNGYETENERSKYLTPVLVSTSCPRLSLQLYHSLVLQYIFSVKLPPPPPRLFLPRRNPLMKLCRREDAHPVYRSLRTLYSLHPGKFALPDNLQIDELELFCSFPNNTI